MMKAATTKNPHTTMAISILVGELLIGLISDIVVCLIIFGRG
jgi:hypothetical protein